MSEVIAGHRLPGGTYLRLLHGDLTQEKVDVIVNAANSDLFHGGGVAGAIVRRGGREIQEESRTWVETHGPVSHARPAVTGGGRLPCAYVIHAVGPIWGSGDEDAKLEQAVRGSLQTADDMCLTSLAMPAISTGIYGFPKERGAKVILDAIITYLSDRPDTFLREVRITLIDHPSALVFAREFERRWPESVEMP